MDERIKVGDRVRVVDYDERAAEFLKENPWAVPDPKVDGAEGTVTVVARSPFGLYRVTTDTVKAYNGSNEWIFTSRELVKI